MYDIVYNCKRISWELMKHERISELGPVKCTNKQNAVLRPISVALGIILLIECMSVYRRAIGMDGFDHGEIFPTSKVHSPCSLVWNTTLPRSGRLRSHVVGSSHFPVFPASFWFVKIHKVGGSTLGGVFRAIASHHGIQMVNPAEGARLKDDRLTESIQMFSTLGFKYVGIANHRPYQNMSLPDPILRFTAVRHPIDRSISQFYFHCSRRRSIEECRHDDDGLMKYLEALDDNYQSQYAFGGDFDEAAELYDFIFVTERMDESLVAFKLAFGLSWRDIAYLPSKVLHTQYQSFADMPLQKQTRVSQILSHKIESDLAFHSYASHRLNETISQIDSFYGHGIYQSQLACFKQVLQEVETRCGEGDFESRWMDNGRNFRCIDSILMTM